MSPIRLNLAQETQHPCTPLLVEAINELFLSFCIVNREMKACDLTALDSTRAILDGGWQVIKEVQLLRQSGTHLRLILPTSCGSNQSVHTLDVLYRSEHRSLNHCAEDL